MAKATKPKRDQKKKSAARTAKMTQEKAKMQKMQKEFIMNLIKQEQERGMFENTPSIPGVIDTPSIQINGPSI